MTLKLTAIGEACLVAREGRRLAAYQDSVGVWTIGIGVTGSVKGRPIGRGMTITSAECDALFCTAVQRYADAVEKAVGVPLADHQADALISICYNIGIGGFAGSTIVRRLNAGDAAGAAGAILMWSKPAAILDRRHAEADQFRTSYHVALPKARRSDARPVAAGAAPSHPLAAHPATTAPVIVPVHVPPASTWLSRFGGWFDRVVTGTTRSDLAAPG